MLGKGCGGLRMGRSSGRLGCRRLLGGGFVSCGWDEMSMACFLEGKGVGGWVDR